MDFFSYEHARQAYEDEQRIIRTGEPLLDVLKTATPGETIRVAREHAGEIHMLMTDLIMPEMNGRNLARRLLALSPDRKYLFMSGYTADVIANQGMLEDELSFIQKPFSAEGPRDVGIVKRRRLRYCPVGEGFSMLRSETLGEKTSHFFTQKAECANPSQT